MYVLVLDGGMLNEKSRDLNISYKASWTWILRSNLTSGSINPSSLQGPNIFFRKLFS